MKEKTTTVGGVYWRRYRSSPVEAPDTGRGEPGGSPGDHFAYPLVILHGLFGSGDNWQSHAKELAERRDVLVPDLPGHGRSEAVGAPTYPDLAEILWESLEQLGYGHEGAPVVLLGHSMGGKVAMAMAFSRPAAVERLVVADIAPKEYPPRHTEIFKALEKVSASNPGSRSDAEKILAGFIPEKAVRLFLLKSLVPRDGSYRWLLDLKGLVTGYDDIRGWPFRDEQYEGASVVIAGGDSPYVQEADHGVIRKHLPEAVIEVIPGTGHWLHVEKRDIFLDIVRSHIC